MSCPHAPAAEAYAQDALSGAARGDFKSHLATCARCAETVRLSLGSRRLLAEVEPFQPSELEWRRIDRTVGDALARRGAAPRRPWLAFATVAAAAAAAALAVVALRGPDRGARERARALVVAAGGEVFVTGAAGTSPLAALHRVEPGERVVTRAGEVLLQTGPGTGLRVQALSEVAFDRLGPDAVAVRLERGAIVAEVRPGAAGGASRRVAESGRAEAFAVHAGDLTVSVRGTAFRVARAPTAVDLEVARGTVSVERGGEEVLLAAPQRMTVPDGLPLSEAARSAGVSAEMESALPLGLAEADLDAVARGRKAAAVTSEPSGAAVHVDGTFRGLTPLSTLEEPGPHRVRVAAVDAEPAEMTLDASAPGAHHVALAPVGAAAARRVIAPVQTIRAGAAPAPAAAPRTPEAAGPAPAPAAAADLTPIKVVATGATGRPADRSKKLLSINDQFNREFSRDLRHCASVRSEAMAAVAKVTVEFRLRADGALESAISFLEEAALDAEFVDCAKRKAAAWRFEIQAADFDELREQRFDVVLPGPP